ncbi:IES6 [Sanghuangporus weigelae]
MLRGHRGRSKTRFVSSINFNLKPHRALSPSSLALVQQQQRPPKGSGKRKTAASSATNTPADASAPQTPTLAESLSYLTYPRSFKNPAYAKNAARRTRTLKSVLSQERERERLDRERRRAERETALAGASVPATAEGEERKDENQMDVDKPSGSETKPTLSVVEEEDIPTYTSIEAPPSILPQKRYCDITGLEAPYTDPATGLRYHDKSIYEFIKTLNASTVKEYLALRGVNPIVK